MKKVLVPLLAWEFVTVGCVLLVMVLLGKSMNLENEHKLAMTAAVGLIVVLFCWPICRSLPRTAGWLVGAVIGLSTPPLCAWLWAWMFPFPFWTDSFEIKVFSLVLGIPSALGGMVVGDLQARSPARQDDRHDH